MELTRLINSETGHIIVSILFGLALSTLFRKICTDRNCLAFYAVSEDKIVGKTFQQGETCFQFKPKSVKCDYKMKTVVESRI